jgi:hypothetical protein
VAQRQQLGGRDDHHHQITKLSHSINAIGPAPHRSGKKREHLVDETMLSQHSWGINPFFHRLC